MQTCNSSSIEHKRPLCLWCGSSCHQVPCLKTDSPVFSTLSWVPQSWVWEEDLDGGLEGKRRYLRPASSTSHLCLVLFQKSDVINLNLSRSWLIITVFDPIFPVNVSRTPSPLPKALPYIRSSEIYLSSKLAVIMQLPVFESFLWARSWDACVSSAVLHLTLTSTWGGCIISSLHIRHRRIRET